jgi:hypothetical protein
MDHGKEDEWIITNKEIKGGRLTIEIDEKECESI